MKKLRLALLLLLLPAVCFAQPKKHVSIAATETGKSPPSVTLRFEEPLKSTERLEPSLKRGAEAWQFFAFVFGALMLLLYAIVDEILKKDRWGWRLLIKVGLFFLFLYLTFWCEPFRRLLVQLLEIVKTEHVN